MQKPELYPIERILSAGTYITAGGVGFIWLILAAIMKKHVRPFLMYHILQSIFISIAYFLICTFAQFIYIIFARVPVFNKLLYLILINPLPFFPFAPLLQTVAYGVVIYLVITSFMGYYSYIPWVSDIIKGNNGG